MLNAMRRQASSWTVKILLGLLILSFAVWGIGDIFLGTGSREVVAEVGDLEVTRTELNREFDQAYRQFSERFGGGVDRAEAASLGLLNQSLQSTIARRLVDQHGQELGLGISDESIAEAIRGNPLFQSQGRFDRSRFELYLRSLGLSEEAFVEQVRSETRRQRLLNAVGGLIEPPETLARQLHSFRNEQRRAELLHVAAEAQEVPAPTSEELETYLEANQDDYMAPEYRDFQLVTLAPEDLEDEIAIDEESLREAYDSRRNLYTTPERREVEQLLASTRAPLEEAERRLAEGAGFAALADEMAEVSHIELGEVDRDALPDAFVDTIWRLNEGEIGGPVESSFGWHLFRVTAIAEEDVEPFEAVRDEIERELVRERAVDELPDLANALDDEIAAGNALDEAAERLGLRLERFEGVDASGRGRDGEPVASEHLEPEMVDKVFDEPEGQTSLLHETQDGVYYMFHVENVEEPRPYEVAEVEDELRQAWTEERRIEAARERAGALLERARAGTTFSRLARDAGEGVSVREAGPLRRGDDPSAHALSSAAQRALFEVDAGDLVDEVFELEGGAGLVRVAEVIPAGDPENLAGLREELAGAMRNDILNQYEAALRARYPVEVNEAAVSSLVSAFSGEGQPTRLPSPHTGM